MTDTGPAASPPTGAQEAQEADFAPVQPWTAIVFRAVARLWVIGLLLAAAVVTGMALNQLLQAESRLQALRKEPGPEAYAVVAYRRELERQIETYRQRRTADTVPVPPARPRLLEEIDLARQRNMDLATVSTRQPQASYTPVVRAPD